VYSAFPGRWGTPIGGIVTATVLLTASILGYIGWTAVALVVLSLGGLALGVIAHALAREGVLGFPTERRRGINLVATRGSEPPPLWLVAHLDSKSQPVPILVRAAAITLLLIIWIAGAAVAVMQLSVADTATTAWLILAALTVVGAVPVIATTVGSRSPGALDNASGVATVLAAAEATREPVIGVCLTSAEELGLAGARAWVGTQPSAGVAINCDGVDDTGAVTCMYSGHRPTALIDAVSAAGKRAGSRVRTHRLLPGVLTDGVALADAGWDVVTLSKGSARTLARIHTRRDSADRIEGAGIAEVARVIVAIIEART
jgi:hypothetical protein